MTNSFSVEMVERLQMGFAGDRFIEWPGEEAAELDVLIAMGAVKAFNDGGDD